MLCAASKPVQRQAVIRCCALSLPHKILSFMPYKWVAAGHASFRLFD